MGIDRFKLDDFQLYQAARAFRNNIYHVALGLPAQEKFCLNPQMRRAALWVSNNIAEGHGRWHYQENLRYCRIARGSVEEVIDDLNVGLDQSYVERAIVEQLKGEAYDLIARINGYIGYLRRVKQSD
jgi:four helix bundle protein